MKIRNGFVSNSSSSSFVLVGGYYELDNMEDYRKVLQILGFSDEEVSKLIERETPRYEEYGYLKYTAYEALMENPKDLTVIASSNMSVCYIGKSIASIGAVLNFTTESREEIAALLGTNVSMIDLHYGKVET